MKTIGNNCTKTLSLILCVAITLHLGLSSTNTPVSAAGGSMSVVEDENTEDLYRVSLSDDKFHIYKTDTGYKLTWDADDGQTGEYPIHGEIEDITLSGNITLYVESDISTRVYMGGHDVVVQPGVTTSFAMVEYGTVTNNGTYKRDRLSLSSRPGDEWPTLLINNGTLEVDSLSLYTSTSIRSTASSLYRVSNSFEKGDFDLEGKVVATSSDTSIKSDGGSFTLVCNGYQRTIEGAVDGAAGDLIKAPTTTTLTGVPDTVYVGQDYDFSQYIRVAPTTYNTTPKLEYANPEASDPTYYAAAKPSAVGNYRVRAYAPETEGFKSSTSESVDYTIEYLPLSEVSASGKYYTVDGVVNGSYVAGSVDVVPASGFKISSGNSYASKLSLGGSDVYNDDGSVKDIEFSFKRNSDDAETAKYAVSGMTPGLAGLIFDDYDPAIYGETADGVETSVGDGDVVVADELSFSIYDENLAKVVIDGKTYTESDFEEGSLNVTLASVVASPKTVTIYAVDKAERELNLSFTLRHTPVDPTSASVTVKDTYVGDDYEPKVTTDSDGEVSFVYRDLNGDPEDYFETKPTAAGKYEVVAYIAATDNYNEIECSDTFTISKRTPTAKITVPDTYVGEDYEPKVTTDSNGDVTVYYGNSNSSGDEEPLLTSEKPTSAGDYKAVAVISETAEYLEKECSTKFTISKIKPEISISVPDTKVGEDYKPTFKTDSDAKDQVVIDYRPANDPDAPFTTTKPTAKGTYKVRATIPETATYLGARATSEFTISVKEAEASVNIDDPWVGTKYAPVLTTNSDGKANAKFEYRAKGAPDSDYTKDKPTAAGTYIVRATVPETATYGKAVCTNEFTISYLPVPSDPYTMKGTNGTNGYFISDVDLIPADGYEISATFGEDYSDSVPYSDDLNVVYLRRTKDGALTSAVAVDTRPKIDKDSPAISDDAGSLIDGSVHYGKDYKLRIDDPNLASLTVNGKPVEDAGDGTELTLDPGNYMRTFLLEAVDEAGNKTLIQITVKADWMKDMILPPDLLLPLIKEEMYKLGDGKWKVTLTNGTSDDPTVYNGNTPVYVMADGDYIFSTVN